MITKCVPCNKIFGTHSGYTNHTHGKHHKEQNILYAAISILDHILYPSALYLGEPVIPQTVQNAAREVYDRWKQMREVQL